MSKSTSKPFYQWLSGGIGFVTEIPKGSKGDDSQDVLMGTTQGGKLSGLEVNDMVATKQSHDQPVSSVKFI